MRRLILLVAALAACSKPKQAEVQTPGHLVMPGFPQTSGKPFSLTEGKSVVNFDGSLIFWDHLATPSLIDAVAQGSRNGRVAKANALAFVDEEVVGSRRRLNDSQSRLIELNARLAKIEATGFADPVHQQEIIPVADQWFEGRLSELKAAGRITEGDSDHARTMFGAYCEFKLWELGTSSLLLFQFKERPTPQRMCEPYYASRGYFQTPGLCDGGSERDFFACIWQDGILKSQLMIPELATATCPGTDVYPSRKAAIESWVQSGLLRKLFQDRTAFEVTNTVAGKMTSYILAANENMSSTGIAARAEYVDLKRCRSAFRRDFNLPIERWDAAAPYALRDIAETEQIDVANNTYKLLPSSGQADTDVSNYNQLAKYLKVFGRRNSDNASEPQASFSDYLFVHPAGGQTLEANGLKNECDVVGNVGNNACANAPDPAFAKFAELKRDLISDGDRAERSALETKVQDAKTAEQRALAQFSERIAKVKEAVLEGVMAVNAPHAATFLASFSMQLVRDGDEMTVAVRFKDSGQSSGDAKAGFYGCVSLTDPKRACAQAPSSLEGQVAMKSLEFSADQGKLSMQLPLDVPSEVGFGANPRSGASGEMRQGFNDLSESSLQGGVVELVFYGNQLQGRLDFFTGEGRLSRNGVEVESGSLSGDSFAESLVGMLSQGASP